ncbi:hypothetical protein BLA60_13670 [Actinophytocola xinjiangensis]|uniref:DUF58 domain-containing protein n=1 Tax=Actinophytocola xinjiangensis TaxID=485602 RepID=A0A7Z0WMY9_9PSEU|nr:hypothetical protein BLA60_13670 [Actinophytocola xinjiangensis]
MRQWLVGRRLVRHTGWRPTDTLVRALGAGFALVVAGTVLHQLPLVLIGVPLLVSGLITPRPSGSPTVTPVRHAETVDSGGTGTVTVEVRPGDGAAFTAVRLPVTGRSGVGPVHLLPAAAGALRARIRWGHWGRSEYLRADHLLASDDGLFVYGPVVGRVAQHTVLPPIEPLPGASLPPRAAGLVGAHRSRRPGDGMELRDIRPFQQGDRLRRIDWRVSLRAAAARGGALVPGTLHVRERYAEADADLVLALDTTVDVDTDLARWSELGQRPDARRGGSLDLGVRAAASLAAAFLRQGDRVSYVDLVNARLGVPVGSGRRQLELVRHALVRSGERVTGGGEPVLRAGQVPLGATVIVLSPFLVDSLVDLTARAARRGNLVIAIDVLPEGLLADTATPWGDAVRTILLAEQRMRLAALADQGVLVLRRDAAASIGLLRRHREARRGVRR